MELGIGYNIFVWQVFDYMLRILNVFVWHVIYVKLKSYDYALTTRVTSLDTNYQWNIFKLSLFSFYPRVIDLYITFMYRLALAYMIHLRIT